MHPHEMHAASYDRVVLVHIGSAGGQKKLGRKFRPAGKEWDPVNYTLQ